MKNLPEKFHFSMQFEWKMWLQWVWMTSPTAVWFSKQGWMHIEQSCADAILTKFFEKWNFKIGTFGTVFYIALRIFRWISLNLCYVHHIVMVDLHCKYSALDFSSAQVFSSRHAKSIRLNKANIFFIHKCDTLNQVIKFSSERWICV